jgi:hypothetical protein
MWKGQYNEGVYVLSGSARRFGIGGTDNAMIGTLVRVIMGFILACLTAGLVQALFLPTTYDLVTSPDGAFAGSQALDRVLLIATHSAIFASAFALIAVAIGEWMGVRSLPYYLFAGATIALLGFAAQFSSEVPGQPTFFNNHALKALLTAGFFAGLVYWLVAGRGSPAHAYVSPSDDVETTGVPAPKSWKNRPRIIVEEQPKGAPNEPKPAKRSTLAERLAEPEIKPAPEKSTPEKPDTETKPSPVSTGSAKPAQPPTATSVPAAVAVEAQNGTPVKTS